MQLWVILSLLQSMRFVNGVPTIAQVPRDVFINSTNPGSFEFGDKCTSLSIRKEWSSLEAEARVAYSDAVLCLQSLPSILPAGLVPGAISRYDDFVATHINSTLDIHINGKFLSWHRQYIFTFEKALQQECNYNGTLPYWDWTLYQNNLETSLLFDGSVTSLGNNGAWNASVEALNIGSEILPRGTGGGCITSGPFVNQLVRLGLIPFADVYMGVVPEGWEIAHPRCLTRDLSVDILRSYNNESAVADLMAQTNIADFQNAMSNRETLLGVHSGGHYILGGAGLDFFASPNEPAFYLHHAMVDKLWTRWQALDPEARTWVLNGTDRIFDPPGAAQITLDYVQNWGFLSKERPTRDLLRTGWEGFCYEYE